MAHVIKEDEKKEENIEALHIVVGRTMCVRSPHFVFTWQTPNLPAVFLPLDFSEKLFSTSFFLLQKQKKKSSNE